jgi:hypothetical protein
MKRLGLNEPEGLDTQNTTLISSNILLRGEYPSSIILSSVLVVNNNAQCPCTRPGYACRKRGRAAWSLTHSISPVYSSLYPTKGPTASEQLTALPVHY